MHTVRITTSQNIDIDYEIAGLGPRILARLLDGLIFMLIITAGVLFTVFGLKNTSFNTVGVIVMIVIYATLYVFYDLLCEIFMNGQSIGKRVMNIKVISADGARPSIGQYLLRWVFRIVDFSLTSSLCALISAAVSEKNQRVGDMVAGTVVIRTNPRTDIRDIAFTPPEDTEYQPVFAEAGQLTDKDVVLIHEVLANYMQTGNSVIVYNITIKLKQVLSIQTDMDDVSFLQTLVKDYNHIAAAAGANDLT